MVGPLIFGDQQLMTLLCRDADEENLFNEDFNLEDEDFYEAEVPED